MLQFSERFVVNNPGFSTVVANIDNATEQQLLQSTELVKMAQTVRRYSILLSKVSLKEIYLVVTQDTDPEISLILLAAKDVEGNFKYNNAQVRALMWGNTSDEYSGFSDGIREISARLAASVLVGAFATQPMQRDTADFLRKGAIENLDRIVLLQQKASAAATLTKSQTAVDSARFYFQPLDFTVGLDDLVLSFFIPNFTTAANWVVAQEYTPGASLNTRQIVADLAHAINTYTLNPVNNTNVIAAVSQAGEQSYHFVDFSVRSMIAGFISEIVTVKIEYKNNPKQQLPFSWGIQLSDLKPYSINSQVLILKSPKVATLASIQADVKTYGRTVLYIRNASTPPPTVTGDLTYRLSVTEDLITTPTVVNDFSPRYSQMALALINSLHEYRAKSRLLGSIIQNDPITITNGVAAIELVAWSITNPEVKLVLDIMSVPSDIEISLGNELGPQVPYSSNPLTAVVTATYSRFLTGAAVATNISTAGAMAVQVGNLTSGLAALTKETARRITGNHYG